MAAFHIMPSFHAPVPWPSLYYCLFKMVHYTNCLITIPMHPTHSSHTHNTNIPLKISMWLGAFMLQNLAGGLASDICPNPPDSAVSGFWTQTPSHNRAQTYSLKFYERLSTTVIYTFSSNEHPMSEYQLLDLEHTTGIASYLHAVQKGAVHKESTTCPNSNCAHCSQLLLVHGMVAYSNRPVVNEMATRAMLISDVFMLPVELPALPYMEDQRRLITSLFQ